jgi:hypothetical protein
MNKLMPGFVVPSDLPDRNCQVQQGSPHKKPTLLRQFRRSDEKSRICRAACRFRED